MKVGAATLAAAAILSGCMPSYRVTDPTDNRRTCLNRSEQAPIVWLSPEGKGENEELQDWCENVGPPVVHADPSGDFSRASGDSIRVLVWNTEAGDGWVTEFLKRNTAIECEGSKTHFRKSSAHVVVLTQESLRRSDAIPDSVVPGALLPHVGGTAHPGALLDIIQVAEQCGLSVFYLPASRNGAEPYAGSREDKGNAILSTLPLSELAGIELPFESVRRIVPVATIRTPTGGTLRVSSVHLITTPPPWRVVVTGNSARERQSLGLIDGLERVAEEYGDRPVIAAGDLNTFSNRETALRKLREYFFSSPPPLGVATRGPVQADHILFRGLDSGEDAGTRLVPGSYTRIDDLYYSDHYPVTALFRLAR